jgi:hypothetical protein
MTLVQLKELLCYWAQNPPLHLMVKAYLGIKPDPAAREAQRDAARYSDEAEIEQLLRLFGAS